MLPVGDYVASISQPIGRTSHKECYAFVWDQRRIAMVPGSAYVVDDAVDRMHREPMVASFYTTAPATNGRPFSFTIINAHTDPDEVSDRATSNEINVLDDVFIRVRQYEYEQSGEEDCILLGDLNVNADKLQEIATIPNMVTLLGNTRTNTRGSKTYDHILIDREMTREYVGRAGVIDFKRDFGLSEQQALLISDHLPIWAEFSAYESIDVKQVASGVRTIR